MFGRAALDTFTRELRVGSAEITGPQTARLLRETAQAERMRVLREQSRRAGVTPTDVVSVDGRRGAPIETAERLVVIEYGYLREVTQEVLKACVARAPKRSGRYARSFVAMANGREIGDIAEIPREPADLLVVNTQPYARRLEVGFKRDGTPFTVRSREGLVAAVAIEAKRRFAGMATIHFTFVDLDRARVVTVRRGKRQAQEPVRFPAIRISPP